MKERDRGGWWAGKPQDLNAWVPSSIPVSSKTFHVRLGLGPCPVSILVPKPIRSLTLTEWPRFNHVTLTGEKSEKAQCLSSWRRNWTWRGRDQAMVFDDLGVRMCCISPSWAHVKPSCMFSLAVYFNWLSTLRNEGMFLWTDLEPPVPHCTAKHFRAVQLKNFPCLP